MSGRYEVAREEWNGIKLEVYYLKEQPWNVPRMMNSMREVPGLLHQELRALRAQGSAHHRISARGHFAQAFPGTMPYSEAIGFIANLNHPDDIDTVFYVVAHEMGHQWWAHQVIGANMEGATLLSETLAQYSALMVMEKEYGRDMMRKFLKYEMDNYLRSRGQERLEGASAADGRIRTGLRSLPQGQRGDVLPERNDRRGCRESGAAQGNLPVRLCAAALSHVLCVWWMRCGRRLRPNINT